MSTISADTLVAIPVYNEAETLERVLRAVRAHAPRVLVVDDGSTDRTPELLERLKPELNIEIARQDRNLGYGRALLEAFAHAGRASFRWVITMDCDEQHEPEALPAFASAIEDDDADIVSGSRYLDPALDADRPPADRRAINATMTAEINGRLGLALTDAFCGFKAHRLSALRDAGLIAADGSALADTDEGYAFPMHLWARAAAAGLRVRELPVRLIYNDPSRTFGGHLDDPAERERHYRRALHQEIARLAPCLEQAPCAATAESCDRIDPEPAHR